MNKDQALQAATGGKKVKRESWAAGKYLYMKEGKYFVTGSGEKEDPQYQLKDEVKNNRKVPHEDRLATDWKIYEDDIPAVEEKTSTASKVNFVNNKSTAVSQKLVR